jgi:deoxyinosine 3'endonuclease (endonuclease V)
VRKFLKKLGVTAQREIETAVREAPAKAVVTIVGVDLAFEVDGEIEF